MGRAAAMESSPVNNDTREAPAPRGERSRPRRRFAWLWRCSVRPPGAKRRLPCIPCYLFSILLFLIVLVMLWLALSSPNGSR